MLRIAFKQKIDWFAKVILSRMLTYYVLVLVLLLLTIDTQAVNLERMNVLLDSANYPLSFINHVREFNNTDFRLAKKYYQGLVAAVPYFDKRDLANSSTTLSRSFAMIAFCDYYLGNTKEALRFYEKALKEQPRHFWILYNLGLVHFKRGEYSQALEYFTKTYSLTLADLDKSVSLDYVNLWPSDYAQKYHVRSLATFHQVVSDSYKLSILAFEKIHEPSKAKVLALRALWIEIDQNNDFFKYYAGLSTHKPDVSVDGFSLMYNPSLNFVNIGQEMIFIQKHLGKIQKKE